MDYGTINLDVDTFNQSRVIALEHLPEGDSIICLWLKLRCSAKRDSFGGLVFEVAGVELTDSALQAVFRYQGKSIGDAFGVLEHYGFIVRNKTSVEVLEWWKDQHDRNSPAYQKWRKSVFERDKYACQSCGAKKNLQAHHIVSWRDTSNNKSLRYEVSNGITLCKPCHLKAHGGRWK